MIIEDIEVQNLEKINDYIDNIKIMFIDGIKSLYKNNTWYYENQLVATVNPYIKLEKVNYIQDINLVIIIKLIDLYSEGININVPYNIFKNIINQIDKKEDKNNLFNLIEIINNVFS